MSMFWVKIEEVVRLPHERHERERDEDRHDREDERHEAGDDCAEDEQQNHECGRRSEIELARSLDRRGIARPIGLRRKLTRDRRRISGLVVETLDDLEERGHIVLRVEAEADQQQVASPSCETSVSSSAYVTTLTAPAARSSSASSATRCRFASIDAPSSARTTTTSVIFRSIVAGSCGKPSKRTCSARCDSVSLVISASPSNASMVATAKREAKITEDPDNDHPPGVPTARLCQTLGHERPGWWA